jgi:hypothetical protein
MHGRTGYDQIRPVTYSTCHDESIPTSKSQRNDSEASMTTRKPKPTLSPIELPAEKLQLVTVTVEGKAPARGGHTWKATELSTARPLLRRGNITLH